MNASLFAALSILLLVPFLSDSYAQSNETPIYLLLQLEIRDQSGQLVGYIESDQTTIFDYQAITKFLDENGASLKKQDITLGDHQVQVFSVVGQTTHQSQTVYSHSVISGASGIVAYANHDGFLINPGDMTVSTWTIIRNLP